MFKLKNYIKQPLTVFSVTGYCLLSLFSVSFSGFYSAQAVAQDYIRYNIKADRTDQGYPRAISKSYWPGLWSSDVDAAVNWGNGKVYFFKGNQYTRYDIKADKADPGYPVAIKNNWPGVWTSGVDAAINWGNTRAYFFALTK